MRFMASRRAKFASPKGYSENVALSVGDADRSVPFRGQHDLVPFAMLLSNQAHDQLENHMY